MAKKTKNNTITFDQYLDEIWEDKGEKGYIAAIMAAAIISVRFVITNIRINNPLKFLNA